MTDLEIQGQKLELEYPCEWSYTLMGTTEALLRAAAEEVAGDRPSTLCFGRRTSGGRYCSVILTLEVQSDEDRRTLFAALHAHGGVLRLL